MFLATCHQFVPSLFLTYFALLVLTRSCTAARKSPLSIDAAILKFHSIEMESANPSHLQCYSSSPTLREPYTPRVKSCTKSCTSSLSPICSQSSSPTVLNLSISSPPLLPAPTTQLHSVRCQLSNSTNYQMVPIIERYQLLNGRIQKISREYWVLLHECVGSVRHFTSGQCIAHSGRQFCAIYWVPLTRWWRMLLILQKNGIDWSFRSSKPVEKV